MHELKQWRVESEAQTEQIARELNELLTPGDCLILTGGLGAGKTTCIRYFCSQFGIQRVTSPTFAIVNVYDANPIINHFDFYRLQSSDELFEIGYYEYIADKDAITLIEWGEMFPEVLPNNRYELIITFEEENLRIFTLNRISDAVE